MRELLEGGCEHARPGRGELAPLRHSQRVALRARVPFERQFPLAELAGAMWIDCSDRASGRSAVMRRFGKTSVQCGSAEEGKHVRVQMGTTEERKSWNRPSRCPSWWAGAPIPSLPRYGTGWGGPIMRA